MADPVSIYNMALSHVGVGAEVQSTTEDSTEANACRRFFDQCRDELLTDFPWPFATKTARLALVANNPTIEWEHSYQYPQDCLSLQRILGGIRNETRAERIPFRIQSDGNGGMLIFTDFQDTVNGTYAAYTMRVDDPTYWPANFVQAMGFLLASYIGARITSGDPMKLADRAVQLESRAHEIAQRAAANEEQPEELPESEFISARDNTNGTLTRQPSFLSTFLNHP
jgi:hypothetical protein